jgi:PPP family 3-phenylpropionic acid transporter
MQLKRKTHIFTVSSLYYAFFFMAAGGFVNYIGLYYSSLNIKNAEIGAISAIGIIAGLIGQPIWGTISDHSKNKTRLLNALNLIAAALVWLIPLSGDSFWFILGSMALFSFFGNAVMPMADSITIALAKQEGIKFSNIRFIGSAGFAFMAVVAGKILSIDINGIFLMFFVLRFLGGITSFFIPSVEGHPVAKEQSDSFLDLFKDRRLTLMYGYVFILSATMGYFHSFHAIYSEQAGIPIELIGLGVMIGSLSQFPFMIFFERIYRRFGITRILIVSGVIFALRWFLYWGYLNQVTLLFLWALHGCNYIVIYLSLADYVAHNVPKRLHTRGQIMNNIALIGPSAMLGGSLGGFFSDIFGLDTVFLACAVIAFASVIAFSTTQGRLSLVKTKITKC